MRKINLLLALVLLTFTDVRAVLPEVINLREEKKEHRPNILWITCEDISPYLGCYGSKEALTPNLDALAQKGICFTNAYANAPVCAVARSTILSGMYASTIGTHQMRSHVQLPVEIPAYPKILRKAGYYCTNNSKKDYNSNFENDSTLWDESSNKAHYKNRKPGQPFFAVFNITVTHESQLSKDRILDYVSNKQIPTRPRVNPANIILPPYHPDLPEFREDWARLHDLITLMDKLSGSLLQELKEANLDDNTIVFFYSDHGGQLSRAKRYIYNVGTHVPFMIYFPEKWRHLSKIKPGGIDDRLVSFVDFAKTLLAITDSKIPEQMQGRIFMGSQIEKEPDYVHFYRDRMSERYDFIRAVTDGRYYFIRNFMPHRPNGRDTRYGYEVQANWKAWEEHYTEGLCNEIQSQFYKQKPVVEFFDTQNDPWHVNNLADLPEYKKLVQELSDETDRWMIKTRDVGLIPEPMFHDLIGSNKAYKTIYEYAQSENYPVEQILKVAKLASIGHPKNLKQFIEYTKNNNPVLRYWAAYGIFRLRNDGQHVQAVLKQMISDDLFAANRIIAAQALGVCGDPKTAFYSLMREINDIDNSYVMLFALNALQYSHTDNFLTIEDWRMFELKNFRSDDTGANFGYSQRIIRDALELWPNRRVVD